MLIDDEDLPLEDEIEAEEPDDEIEEDEGAEEDDGQGGEGGQEADEDEDDAPVEPQRQRGNQEERQDRLTRGQRRHQELANAKEAERRRADELQQKLDRIEAENQKEAAERQRAAQQNRTERLSRMTPEERASFEIQEVRDQITYRDEMDKFRRHDESDRNAFKVKVQTNPVYKRHEAKVEETLAQVRKQGQNMAREALLRYIVGDEALKATEKNSKRLTPSKSRKVPKSPSNSRADASINANRGRKPTSERQALRERLKDMPL